MAELKILEVVDEYSSTASRSDGGGLRASSQNEFKGFSRQGASASSRVRPRSVRSSKARSTVGGGGFELVIEAEGAVEAEAAVEAEGTGVDP